MWSRKGRGLFSVSGKASFFMQYAEESEGQLDFQRRLTAEQHGGVYVLQQLILLLHSFSHSDSKSSYGNPGGGGEEVLERSREEREWECG